MRKLSIFLTILLMSPLFMFGCFEPKVVSIIINKQQREFVYGDVFSYGQMSVVVRYDDNTTSDVSLIGAKNDAVKSIITTDDLIIDYSNFDSSRLGTYDIVIKYKNDQTITKKYSVTVKAKDGKNYDIKDVTCVYDGQKHTLDIEELKQNSNLKINFKRDASEDGYALLECPEFKNAGVYEIYYAISEYGYDDYYGMSKVTITPKDLTVKIKDVDLKFGEIYIPKLNMTDNCEIVGLVSTDIADYVFNDVSFTSDYNKDTNGACGKYEIIGNGFESSNYNITIENGTLTVRKLKNELVIRDKVTIIYGDIINISSYVLKNLGGGELQCSYRQEGTDYYLVKEPTNVGKYSVKVKAVETGEYEATETDFNLEIIKADIRIIVDKYELIYNTEFDETKTNIRIEGMKGNDNKSVLDGVAKYTTNYKVGDNVGGDYIVSISGFSSVNYNIEYVSGKLEVKRAKSDVEVNIYTDRNSSKLVYNGDAVKSDVFTNISGEPVNYYYKNSATAYQSGLPKNAGRYTIKVQQNLSQNYEEFVKEIVIVIEQLTAKLSWEYDTVVYDGEKHCPTVTCSNICGSDVVNIISSTDVDCINANLGNSRYVARAISISNDNYILPIEIDHEFTITKKIVAIPTIERKVYNGSVQTSGLLDTREYIVFQDYGIEYGRGKVYLQLRDGNNYQWVISEDVQIELTFEIERANNIITRFEIPTWEYGTDYSQAIIEAIDTDANYEIHWWPLNDQEYGTTTRYFNIKSPDVTKIEGIPQDVAQYNARLIIFANARYNMVESQVIQFNIIPRDVPYAIPDIVNIKQVDQMTLQNLFIDLRSRDVGYGQWYFVDENENKLTELNNYAVEGLGLHTFRAKIFPHDMFNGGYLPVATDVYYNITENDNEIDKENVFLANPTISLGNELQIGINLKLYVTINGFAPNIYYSFDQLDIDNYKLYDTESQSIMTITTQDIGKKIVVWLKIEQSGYNPYYCHVEMTITE